MQLKSIIPAVLILGLLAACNSARPTAVSTANVTVVTQPTRKSGKPVRATPDPKRDKVIISDVTKDENGLEKITITNVSNETMDIKGYYLYMSETTERYRIQDVKLAPGESYYVYNGPGAKDQKDGASWRDEPALQVQGDDVTLLNTAGQLIWVYVYYP